MLRELIARLLANIDSTTPLLIAFKIGPTFVFIVQCNILNVLQVYGIYAEPCLLLFLAREKGGSNFEMRITQEKTSYLFGMFRSTLKN